jgi:hypothetical protein
MAERFAVCQPLAMMVLERSTNSPLTIDVQVVDVLADTGITDKVARLVPIAIVKGRWREASP